MTISDVTAALVAAAPLVTASGVLITIIMQAINNYKSSAHAAKIAELEKNTNSIKDALVKVTGEAALAKGVLQGRAQVLDENK